MNFNRVLIATDFSPGGEKILICLNELQELGAKEIVLVWVVESPEISQASLIQKVQLKKLNRKRVELESRGFEVRVEAPIGQPYREIHRLAREQLVDLIVITSRGKNLVRDFFIGSTASRVIRTTEHPLLIERVFLSMQKGEPVCDILPRRFSRILLATDFSPRARSAEQLAVKLSCQAEKIAIISVVDEGISQQEIDEKRDQAHACLRELQQECENHCPDPHIIVEQGIASSHILNFARQYGATVIIMGTRGKSDLPGILLGSTAENVARRADCSVLLIP